VEEVGRLALEGQSTIDTASFAPVIWGLLADADTLVVEFTSIFENDKARGWRKAAAERFSQYKLWLSRLEALRTAVDKRPHERWIALLEIERASAQLEDLAQKLHGGRLPSSLKARIHQLAHDQIG
jgi:hypothetical protein